MTGAGASHLAFVKNTGFDTESGTPTYYLPGRNPVVQELDLQRTLQRLRTPSNAEAVNSIAGNFEGAFGVEYSMSSDTHDDVRDIVFNDGGTGFTFGNAPWSTWYVGSQYLDSSDTVQTVERELRSCIPLSYAINYQQQQNTVRETLTMAYADEIKNTSKTPGSITTPSDGNDAPFHGVTLTVDPATVNKLQSATLRFDGPLYRFQRDTSPHPSSAVLANPQTTLEASTIYTNDNFLSLAYDGTTGTTTPADTISSFAGDLAFSDGTVFARYNFSKMKPNNYSWSDLINADNDLTEPVTYQVNGGINITTT